MNTDGDIDYDSAQAEFVNIIQNFRQSLVQQKSRGFSRIELQPETIECIKTWDTEHRPVSGSQCQGPMNASIVIIDSDGYFYEGNSGGLLKKILAAMNLSPDQVCLCSISGFHELEQQILKNSPKVLITLGERAAQLLLGTDLSFETIRSRLQAYKDVMVMPTLAPSLLLKEPAFKRQVWEDMKQVMKYASLSPAATASNRNRT